ncbi:protein GLUTAMINE DUMPER 3-like [Cornus florida]|uniref:protein GLUTAMINE DUMPER 3-like n=1 Tax=Cornus florida TaxID=4283 RepID=UPI00289ECACC|nr:protein GLUTAMINE DUMPER 3-like [Cornus florida]
MRTIGATLDSTTMTTPPEATFSPPATLQHDSPWHSPVPYLFGGLAAMMGLITFALLILACSYLKLSGHLDSNQGGERDSEVGDDEPGDSEKAMPVFEEKIVVIMAGDVNPTFLATPMSNRASSLGDNNGYSTDNMEREKAEIYVEKQKEEMGDQTTRATMENGEANLETSQESHESLEQNH